MEVSLAKWSEPSESGTRCSRENSDQSELELPINNDPIYKVE